MTRVALDTNILVYLAGVWVTPADQLKIDQATALIEALKRRASLVVAIQALGELFVALRRNDFAREEARETVAAMAAEFETANSEPATLVAALDLAVKHKLQFWDSMIITASRDAGCSVLISEDMQNGFRVRGITVVNPFADKLHSSFARLLA